jgi:hypothetical protein
MKNLSENGWENHKIGTPRIFGQVLSHRILLGGDVGNRTRVRKISPTDFYERSLLFSLARRITAGRDSFQPAARTRESFFCT